MKIQELFNDYHIPFQTEGNKHCRPGWANTHCPFCSGSRNYHLGVPFEGNTGNCWRCGPHSVLEIITKLLNISYREAKQIIREYGGRSYSTPATKITIRTKSFQFPSNCTQMNMHHHRYLQSRNFDSYALEKTWGLMGTGPVSFLDKKDYKNRIIIPIEWNGKIVSFQGRSIAAKTKLRYKACPQDRESMPHQTILYGKQAKWNDIGICVEGVTDVWRLGISAFAVFGISYTTAQIRAIANHFKRVIILFDDDPQAQTQSDKLMAELRFRGVIAHREDIKGDPANLNQEDANALVKELTRRIY